jgi:hypothetical protein
MKMMPALKYFSRTFRLELRHRQKLGFYDQNIDTYNDIFNVGFGSYSRHAYSGVFAAADG